MTNFKSPKQNAKDSFDLGLYSWLYNYLASQNWQKLLTRFPDLYLLPMPFTFNSLSMILRCYSYIFHWRNTTYKLFTPFGGLIKNAELVGNRKALKTNFWSDNVIQVSPYPLSLAMVKGIPIAEPNLDQVERFISEKLEETLKYASQKSSVTYNYQKLRKLGKQGLDLSLIEACHEVMHQVELPITSSHGDLHIDNMILVSQEIKLIDWSMYNGNGSFITDYIHFYNFLEAEKKKISWTIAILKDQEYLLLLAKRLNVAPVLLKIVYTLNRIAGEAGQYPRTNLLPTNQVAKYNSVLTHLLTSIKQNV